MKETNKERDKNRETRTNREVKIYMKKDKEEIKNRKRDKVKWKYK